MSTNHLLGEIVDTRSVNWDVALDMGGTQPSIVFTQTGYPRYSYNLASLLTSHFFPGLYGGVWLDSGQSLGKMEQSALLPFLTQACAILARESGRFEVRWVPCDEVPF